MFELPAEAAQGIPAEVLSHPSLQRYNSVGDALKGAVNAFEYQGRSFGLPSKDSKPEDLDKWAGETSTKLKDYGFAVSKLGELPPEKPEGYEFQIDGVDPATFEKDEVVQAYRQWAHKEGLSKGIAQKGLLFFRDVIGKIQPKADPVEFIDAEGVKGVMAETFKGEAPQRIEEYKKGVEVLSTTIPGLKDLLNEGAAPHGKKYVAIGDHPVMVQLITEIGRLTSSDFSGGTGARSEAAQSAESEIEDIMHNKQNPKHELWRKGDKKTREYVDGLYQQITGGR